MVVLGFVVLGCTGTPAPPAEESEPVAVAPATHPMVIPTTPPMSGDPIAQGGLREAPAPAPGAPPADARDFQPVSIPLGPREGGGVKWDHVKTATGAPVKLDGNEVYDPALQPDPD